MFAIMLKKVFTVTGLSYKVYLVCYGCVMQSVICVIFLTYDLFRGVPYDFSSANVNLRYFMLLGHTVSRPGVSPVIECVRVPFANTWELSKGPPC